MILIMPILSQKSNLSHQERIKLVALIREAENRGLPVLKLLHDVYNKNVAPWLTDSNGYFSRRDGKLFEPYPEQAEFVASMARFALFLGGRGSGKSCGGAQKAVNKLSKGQPGMVVNPKFENFKDSTWPEFRSWIPWNHVVLTQRYRADLSWQPTRPFNLVFDNGAFVICKGLHDPGSARGPNLNWFWYDEAQEDETGEAWNTANASVRIGDIPQAWATATGRGTYHWLFQFFVEQEFPENVIEEIKKLNEINPTDIPFIEWFHGTIYDNADNLDPGFMAAIISQYPEGAGHEQEVMGKFADPGGNRGDAKWFNDRILDNAPISVKNRVRYWDLAATEKKVAGKRITDPDETVGTLLSYFIDEKLSGKYQNQFVIENQVSDTWEWADIKENIIKTAKADGPLVPIYIEKEPGSGGINQIAQIKLDVAESLPGWTVRSHDPKGDKIVRADVWFAEACENENHPIRQFWMVKGDWNKGFLSQLSSFPNARHDDKVDSVSGARVCCAPIFKWTKQKFMHIGMQEETKDDKNDEENAD